MVNELKEMGIEASMVSIWPTVESSENYQEMVEKAI